MSAKSILSILTVLGAAGLAAPALWAQGRPPRPLKDRSRVARDLSREKAEVREIFLELDRMSFSGLPLVSVVLFFVG